MLFSNSVLPLLSNPINLTVYIKKSVKVPKRVAEERMEKERMHDVLLLLTHLCKNEEVTIKLILDCLYDVGSVNLINQKVQSRSLNTVAKSITRMSKPAFRFIALRWFQKNCPKLIADWLHLQVSFTVQENQIIEKPVPTAIVSEVQLTSLSPAENTSRKEIQRLRSEVRCLAGVSIASLAALTSTMIWFNQNPQAATNISETTLTKSKVLWQKSD